MKPENGATRWNAKANAGFGLSFLDLASHRLQLKFEHFPRCLKLNNVVLKFVRKTFKLKVNYLVNEQHSLLKTSRGRTYVDMMVWRNEHPRDTALLYQQIKSISEIPKVCISQAHQSVLKSMTEPCFVTWTELFSNFCYKNFSRVLKRLSKRRSHRYVILTEMFRNFCCKILWRRFTVESLFENTCKLSLGNFVATQLACVLKTSVAQPNEAEKGMAIRNKLAKIFAGALYQFQLFENKRKEQSTQVITCKPVVISQ